MESNKNKKQKKGYKFYDIESPFDKDDFYYLDRKLNGKRMEEISKYTQKLNKIFFSHNRKILFSPIEVLNMKNEILVFIKLLNVLRDILGQNIDFCKNDIREKQLDDLMLLVEILERGKIINDIYI